MYIITKRDPKDDRVYTVNVADDEELEKHISACFILTDQEILAVLKVIKPG